MFDNTRLKQIIFSLLCFLTGAQFSAAILVEDIASVYGGSPCERNTESIFPSEFKCSNEMSKSKDVEICQLTCFNDFFSYTQLQGEDTLRLNISPETTSSSPQDENEENDQEIPENIQYLPEKFVFMSWQRFITNSNFQRGDFSIRLCQRRKNNTTTALTSRTLKLLTNAIKLTRSSKASSYYDQDRALLRNLLETYGVETQKGNNSSSSPQ